MKSAFNVCFSALPVRSDRHRDASLYGHTGKAVSLPCPCDSRDPCRTGVTSLAREASCSPRRASRPSRPSSAEYVCAQAWRRGCRPPCHWRWDWPANKSHRAHTRRVGSWHRIVTGLSAQAEDVGRYIPDFRPAKAVSGIRPCDVPSKAASERWSLHPFGQ